jgi:hypothetical protein
MRAEQFANKFPLAVILSGAKNLSRRKQRTKRDSSRNIGAQNDSGCFFRTT